MLTCISSYIHYYWVIVKANFFSAPLSHDDDDVIVKCFASHQTHCQIIFYFNRARTQARWMIEGQMINYDSYEKKLASNDRFLTSLSNFNEQSFEEVVAATMRKGISVFAQLCSALQQQQQQLT